VHRVQLSDRREDFIVVDAMWLHIALHHKACLVLAPCSSCLTLNTHFTLISL
jgi:hypothetical protein